MWCLTVERPFHPVRGSRISDFLILNRIQRARFGFDVPERSARTVNNHE